MARLIVIDTRRRNNLRSIRLPARSPVALTWGHTPLAAVVSAQNQTLVVHVPSGRTRRLGRWIALDWSSDGDVLLATDATRRSLFLLDSRGRIADELGDPGVGRIYDAAWLGENQ